MVRSTAPEAPLNEWRREIMKQNESNMNETNCNCSKTKCERHGNCIECRKYHENKNQIPRCERKSIWKIWNIENSPRKEIENEFR